MEISIAAITLLAVVEVILGGAGVEALSRRKRQSGCTNPDGRQGQCINIRSCQTLYDLLVTQSSKASVRDYLRKSQCGYDGNDPKVCCTDNTSKPDDSGGGDASQGIFPTECGKSDSSINRIVGGRPAALRAWPWMAALGYRGQYGTIQWRCGAALITNQHVVTAAHCLQSIRPVTVRLGDLDLNSTDDGANHVDTPIDANGIIRHTGYSTRTLLNDIAIIKMRNPVRFSPDIQPICLPFHQQVRSKNIVGFTPFIAGWGDLKYKGASSTRLHEAQVEVKSLPDCKAAYSRLPTKTAATIDESVICAGGGTKDACQGDSGGPLMLPNKGRFYLMGVVSYGHKCAEPGFPGIYTKVTQFEDWILQNVK